MGCQGARRPLAWLLLLGIGVGGGCTVARPPSAAEREWLGLTKVLDVAELPPPVVTAAPRLLGARRLAGAVARRRISFALEERPLAQALREIAEVADLDLIVDPAVVAGQVTLRLQEIAVGDLLEQLERLYPIEFHVAGRRLLVTERTSPALSLLVYPLPAGLVTAELPADFDSLQQLSFISRAQRAGSDAETPPRVVGSAPGLPAPAAAPAAAGDPAAAPALGDSSHLERFLARIAELLPWPEGATWHLDRRHNLLFLRAPAETLRQAQQCLDLITPDPLLVEIEARFLELREGFGRELGVELALPAGAPLSRRNGETRVEFAAGSGTDLGVAPLGAALPGGLQAQVLGVLSQPRFDALVRALEEEERGRLLSAPSVTTVNNSRATIAITTNLPYIEDYRPIFDSRVVASEGIASEEANVALVAQVNDSNFTGIVLNVTPSVGAERRWIQLRVQPVVRDQVDSIALSNGALVEGVTTPTIERPVIETRYIDTQMALPSGATIVLGGLETTAFEREVTSVPWLGALPWVGALFRRETLLEERRDLLVLITARILPTIESAQPPR